MNYRIILTTTSTEAEAKKIADSLVQSKLAACVNVIPNVSSIYRWEEKVTEDNEFLLLIKTNKSKEQEVQKQIQEIHSYDVPEVISLPIEGGSEKYLNWIDESL